MVKWTSTSVPGKGKRSYASEEEGLREKKKGVFTFQCGCHMLWQHGGFVYVEYLQTIDSMGCLQLIETGLVFSVH